jgi:hypothetical protein
MKKFTVILVIALGGITCKSFSQEINAADRYPAFVQPNTVDNSREKFILKGVASEEKLAFYKESISKANMESYRLREKEVIIQFEEGFECILPSAKQLIIKGYELDPNSYQLDFSNRFLMPVFQILADGQLVAKYEKVFK